MLVRCYERYSAQTQWRHGFYAFNSFDQLSFADPLDGVSPGTVDGVMVSGGGQIG